jgi:shikimate kinase
VTHVLLIGFMGSGKSTVGRMLARRTGRPFVDLDEVIAASTGKTIASVFEDEGEEAFRVSEHAALVALRQKSPSVVACGGGIVLRGENRALLVYLKVSAEEALARIGDVSGRPLLAGAGASLAPALLASREALYTACADLVVPTEGLTPSEVVEDVAGRLEMGAA